jgi:hypothetical protein
VNSEILQLERKHAAQTRIFRDLASQTETKLESFRVDVPKSLVLLSYCYTLFILTLFTTTVSLLVTSMYYFYLLVITYTLDQHVSRHPCVGSGLFRHLEIGQGIFCWVSPLTQTVVINPFRFTLTTAPS